MACDDRFAGGVNRGSTPAVVAGVVWVDAAIDDYVESARALPAGVLLAARHFPSSAEIHLMAVERAWHRRGAGRALVSALEADLIAEGFTLLQVKTMGPTQPDAAYAGTRRFYEALGFLPLEELHGLWPGNPCLVMVKPLRVRAGGPGWTRS